MLNLISKILGSGDTGAATEEDALTAHLALAVLLFEAAHADGECSAREKDHLRHTLIADFGVAEQDIDQLLEDSAAQHKDYVDLFHYTRFINESFDQDKKIKILESVWQVILADGLLEAHEDHFVHKLASLFNLSHKDLIDAKARARKRLA